MLCFCRLSVSPHPLWPPFLAHCLCKVSIVKNNWKFAQNKTKRCGMLCTICACCEISFSLNFHFICTRICRAFLSEALAFPFSPDFPRKPTIKCHIRGVRETPEPPFSPLFFSGGVAIVVRSPSANVLFCWPRLERAFEIFMHANSSEKHEKRKQQNEMKSKTTGKKS